MPFGKFPGTSPALSNMQSIRVLTKLANALYSQHLRSVKLNTLSVEFYDSLVKIHQSLGCSVRYSYWSTQDLFVFDILFR